MLGAHHVGCLVAVDATGQGWVEGPSRAGCSVWLPAVTLRVVQLGSTCVGAWAGWAVRLQLGELYVVCLFVAAGLQLCQYQREKLTEKRCCARLGQVAQQVSTRVRGAAASCTVVSGVGPLSLHCGCLGSAKEFMYEEVLPARAKPARACSLAYYRV